MKRTAMSAAVLASVVLAGCGGASQTPTQASGPAVSGAQPAAAAKPARAVVAACSVLRARDVSRAFGARAPTGRAAGASSQSQCTYRAGSQVLRIIVTPASADMRRAFGRPPFAQHEHRVTVPGATAVA